MRCRNKCAFSDTCYVHSAVLYTVCKLGPSFIQIGSDSRVASFGLIGRASFPGNSGDFYVHLHVLAGSVIVGKFGRILKLFTLPMYRVTSSLAALRRNCIRKAPGLNLARNTRCSVWGLSHAVSRTVLQTRLTTAYFQILSDSLFTGHSTFRRYWQH